MRITEIFGIDKSQGEIDFIDIDIDQDKALFIDPYFLSIREDRFSLDCTLTINSFMSYLISLIQHNKIKEAKEIFIHFNEPNETCLGLSQNAPKGHGVGTIESDKIFNSIYESDAIQTGLISDLEDSILFVEGIDKDKISDMTTNLIRYNLIKYTQQQCLLHNIPLQANISSGFFRDPERLIRDNIQTDMLVIDDRKIILVPKGVSSFAKKYTPKRYYHKHVLEYLQNDHVLRRSHLVQNRKDGTPFVTKKSLEFEHPYNKEFLRSFTKKHPKILEELKKETSWDLCSLVEEDIDIDFVRSELSEKLINKLNKIKMGNKQAGQYHNLILSIIHFVFYPYFICPQKEKEIHDGRKRIDIIYQNGASDGFLDFIQKKLRIPCPYIPIECKNYSTDPVNPELDQLAGRFSPNRGQFGILSCRQFNNRKLFIKRCVDTFKDSRGLIIPLVDEDFIKLLQLTADQDTHNKNIYIQDIISQIIIS